MRVEDGGAVGEAGREGAVWIQTCAALKGELGEAAFGSYLAPARLRRARSGRLVVVTHTGVACDWVRRHWPSVKGAWERTDPERRPLDLRSRQDFELEEGPEVREVASAPIVVAAPAPAVVEPTAEAPRTPSGLQARYTFDSFVTGPSNEFARSVARGLANGSAGPFNLVVLHSPYGFGKTHLLHAIAWEAQARRPQARVVYMTADAFVQGFVRAVMDKQGAAFKEELRSADLLLIDDIHVLGGKKQSQEELFHTLTALVGENRRVVFSSDRPPSALGELDARLRSHLSAALVCGIEPADAAMRLKIAESKVSALTSALGLPGKVKPEVLQLLADRFPTSVRELEGGVNTLVARAGERLGALGVDEALQMLRPHLKAGGEKRITVDEIQKAVCEHYGLKQADLLSQARTRAIARPRQVAMYLAKTLTPRSYPDIGRRFGNRDHTTVLHAVRQIERFRVEDPAIAGDVEAVTRKLRD